MEKENKRTIPDQRVGSKLDTEHTVNAPDEHKAREIFSRAVDRLLDVNCWDKVCGPMSAVFRLTDAAGNEIKRHASPGDHFKIDVPGPGPSAGNGYDWVQIEALDDSRNPLAHEESVTLRVRPSTSPQNNSNNTAHFFSSEATSSFRVTRIGNVVRAEVHGRNEIPNTSDAKGTDKVRNALVGTGATAGFSSPQWKSLVNGLLEKNPVA